MAGVPGAIAGAGLLGAISKSFRDDIEAFKKLKWGKKKANEEQLIEAIP